MARRPWLTSALHRFTVLAYSPGTMSLTVQTRDLDTLPFASRITLGQEIDQEGVYYRETDGKWIWNRDLEAKARPLKPVSVPFKEATIGILEVLPPRGEYMRAGKLFEAVQSRGVPRRTVIRHVQRLCRMGLVLRARADKTGVYYGRTELRLKNPPAASRA